MTGGDKPQAHVPVLLTEVLQALTPVADGQYVDGTFGAGGYTRALLDAAPRTQVIAIDRDPDAIAGGQALVAASEGRLLLVPGRFSSLDMLAAAHAPHGVDGVVLDIGVSSMQLDQAERGFSFRFDGPLDMRMSQDGICAADLVNREDEARLADIFYHFGEERRSRAVAHAIVEARRKAAITTTKQLADIIATVVRAEPRGPHPATRSFQGLRIALNDELGELVAALHAAERCLKPGGVLAVVTFHSLEDRIVKQFFASRSRKQAGGSRFKPAEAVAPASFEPVMRGPIVAGEAETFANPRARSAKLRAARRTTNPAQAHDEGIAALARLPDIDPARKVRRA